MSSAERYLPHYTVVDYQQWPGDWELWQGIPIAMTPSPFGPHQRMALKLAMAFERAIENGGCPAVVLQETDWIVSQDTIVRPDVSVLCGEVPPQHIQSTPAVLIEVLSPSTRGKDLTVKKDLYLLHGARYYLSADPDTRRIQFATPDSPDWRPVLSGLDIQICESCRLTVDLSQLQ